MRHLITMIASAQVAFGVLASAALGEESRLSPKEQVEQLMNEGIVFAERMLREHGEFFPFGVVRKSDGSIEHVAGYDGREQPPAADLITLLNDGFRAKAESGEYTATAIFFDVLTVPPGSSTKTDAVQVGLEHTSGYCVDVFFPYQRSAEGAVQFEELFASERQGVVFECR